MPAIALNEIALRLCVATLLAGAAGLERQEHRQPAGLRTHALVGLGSCLFMIASAYGFNEALGPNVHLDPSRVAAQIVTGIGFLGAGTIITRRETIRGLTTAASIWMAAAIGLATGGGMYAAATLGTALALIILYVLKRFEKRMDRGGHSTSLELAFDNTRISMVDVCRIVENAGVKLQQIQIVEREGEETQAVLRLAPGQNDPARAALSDLSNIEGIKRVQIGTEDSGA